MMLLNVISSLCGFRGQKGIKLTFYSRNNVFLKGSVYPQTRTSVLVHSFKEAGCFS